MNPLDPHFPCGRTRRQFLRQTGCGFFGTAMTWLLAQDGLLARAASAAEVPVPSTGIATNRSPIALRSPHFPAKAKSVIFLYMVGGPSHLDTFDHKPELNKRHGEKLTVNASKSMSQRASGELKGAPWKWARHGQSGIEVSELFPHVAGCVDDMAVVRGMVADSAAHGAASLQMNTGYLRTGFPSLGSWAMYGLGTPNQNMPGFVVLVNGAPYSGAQNWGSGFLPSAFQGSVFNTAGDPILNLKPAGGISADGQRRQLDLLAKLNAAYDAAEPANSELAARIANYELAFRMQASAPEVVDLAQETKSTLASYGIEGDAKAGREKTAKFGRSCLMARRLVERGVRFVQIFHSNWDTHGGNDRRHQDLCGQTDQPIAGLLKDLKQRGLLDETLVVWGGEFGRTPFGKDGRDHHASGFTMWMAGGGVKGGQAYGSTDDLGFFVADNKVHVHDLHATILHLMGLDHERLTYRFNGRDYRVTDVAGNVVRDLIA